MMWVLAVTNVALLILSWCLWMELKEIDELSLLVGALLKQMEDGDEQTD